jgi:secretion/DNA translocation related TadE-like protein
VLLILTVMVVGCVDLTQALAAVSRAQTGADAAALAAAQQLALPGTDPSELVAARLAEANGAELVSCDCSGTQAVVTVRVQVGPFAFLPGLRYATATARAVVGG